MGRNSGEDQSEWSMPTMYAFVGDYGPFKAKGFDPIGDILVWLHHSGDPNDELYCNPRRHPMHSLAGPIQDLLCGDRKKEPRFSTVLVVDVADMFETYEEYHEALFEETNDTELTKNFGKKLLKLFQKLLVYKCAMAARGELCDLLLKLYKALEQLDTHAKLEENNTVAEIWLLHPELSSEYVEKHFPQGTTKHPVQLNVVYNTEWSDPIPDLQQCFPSVGNVAAFDGEVNDWFAIVARRRDAKKTPEKYSPSHCNNLGKMLFVSLVRVEMNKFSKQYERNCTEITADLLQITHPSTTDAGADATAIDWSTCERQIGGLLLRGNRCLLVRSIFDEYEGLRIPSVVAEAGESPHETAIRAVSELAEVDETEMRALYHVPPVYVYAPNQRELLVELYPLYATSPPPDGGASQNDDEDPEDPYDWFRFPKAQSRMADDPPSVAALRSMVLHLMQAANVGLVPTEWGGIFGQECQALQQD